MRWRNRIGEALVARRRLVVAVLLVATLVLASGAANVESSSSYRSVESQSSVAVKEAYVEERFGAHGEKRTRVLLVTHNRSGNVLTRRSLLATLEYQKQLRANETVAPTLAENDSIVGVANVVARAALLRERRGPTAGIQPGDRRKRASLGPRTQELVDSLSVTSPDAGLVDDGAVRSSQLAPSLDEQIAALRSTNESELDSLLSELFRPNGTSALGRAGLQLLPSEYEPGSTTARARMMVVTQRTAVEMDRGASLTEATLDGQLAVRALARDGPGEYALFGRGFVDREQAQSMSDSLAIVGPLALLFVLATLAVSYRDLLDVILGALGVLLVLVWTFGFLGWAGIRFNQLMIAVPVILVGLAVDYNIHVVMRYREQRSGGEDGASPTAAMKESVSTVGVALLLVTVTTAIGFLTNLTSTLPAIQDFGLAAAVGIVAAFVVFGALIPALKVELDDRLERYGLARDKRAFGAGGGRLSRALGVGVSAARRASVVVLLAALLVSSAAGYAGTQVGTSFSEERFVSDDPPDWAKSLPEPFAAGDYHVKRDMEYIRSHFQTPDRQVTILSEGDVTDPGTLHALHRAHRHAAGSRVTYVEPGGRAAVRSPLTLMQTVAADDAAFNATFAAADTDGDGVPERNVEAVYDALFAVAPDRAARLVHRTDDGEYRAIRMVVAVEGTASPAAVSREMEAVASVSERPDVTVTATGGPVTRNAILERIVSTVLRGLALTVGLVFVVLVVAFRLSGRRATLGALTLVPPLLSITWVLGTMYLLGVPFSFTTAIVGSVSVGLGVDYAIHVSERFSHELARRADRWRALVATARGTGGALASSAATTAGGFGILAFTFLPGLRQFGLIIGLSLLYSFAASVFVFPSVLALWAAAVDDGTAATPTGTGVDADD